jgi:hypothetical protein
LASAALKSWQGDRKSRLDELFAAHAKVGGTVTGGPGRRWNTEQLNWALILKISAEFQGFARDLHDLSAERFADWVAPGNGHVRHTVRTTLVKGRQLNRGNATTQNLRADFGRFGVNTWTELRKLDARNDQRAQLLDDLQSARNAIAHGDEDTFQQLHDRGYKLNLADARKWHRAVNGLTAGMDRIMANHLARLFAQAKPW